MLWMAGLLACGGDGEPRENLVPIPGTTHRIGVPRATPNTELELKILTTESDCYNAVSSDAENICLPHINRSTGEVRLSFKLRDDAETYPLPLSAEHIRVFHAGSEVLAEGEGQTYTLIPHVPRSARQMFILMIDGSASMKEETTPGSGVTRMDAVREALLLDEVKDAFFSSVGKSVVIFEFTSGTPRPLGGEITILEGKRPYAAYIKQHLRVSSGYTHLYDAVNYASGTLLKEEAIANWLDTNTADPTIVVLTDGFNNIQASDTCASNARPLSRLMENLQRMRQGGNEDRTRPAIYTVGFGQPIRPNFKLPEQIVPKISEKELCGRRQDWRIDGNLEDLGIDNPSLSWIAAMGGGGAFVRNTSRGLGEAFQAAAAKRYEWFEVRYRVGFSNVRRSFVTRLKLEAFATAEAKVRIHPSAWLDAPPGTPIGQGWTMPSPYRHTLTIIIPTMGLLILLSYLSAAWFNTRRVVFGRTRPPSAPTDGTGAG